MKDSIIGSSNRHLKADASYNIFNESRLTVPFVIRDLEFIIRRIEEHECCRYLNVEVVFVGDDEILNINRKYLNHNYITDVITFPYHEEGETAHQNLEGTLFCCASQIQRQSHDYGTEYELEILRVVIHGLLHLVGYKDDNPDSQNQMRNLENRYITLYQGN